MTKVVYLIFGILFIGTAIPLALGVYPVALVDGEPIFYSTWKKLEEASKNFTSVEEQSKIGGRPINFSSPENARLLLEIRRSTLTFLIEDLILRQVGGSLVEGFEVLSREKVAESVQDERNTEKAVRVLYGLDLDDFKNLVLLPQARRDIAKEALSERNQSVEDWLSEVKKQKKIRLLSTSFRWNGESVE